MSLSPSTVRAGIAAAAALVLVWTSPDVAAAARCGGNRMCQCGDRVVRDYLLPDDLGPCTGTGLEIAAAVVLDGGGHTIRGSQGKGFGIRTTPAASGSRIRNLKVTGFERGLRIQDVRSVHVEDVEAFRNGDPRKHEGYGIDLAHAAADAVFTRVRVHHNADEGIHFGPGTRGNRIVDSEIHDNYRENVYVLATEGTRIERTRLRSPGQGAANVYVKFARGTTIEGSTIEGGTVQIRGGSSDTRLVGNTLEDASVVLQDQKDRRFGSGRPSRTSIRGGRITVDGSCIRVDSAADTLVADVELRCADAVAVGGSSEVALAGLSNTRVQCVGKGTVRRVRSVDVRFVAPDGTPRPRVQLRTRSGRVLGEASADGRYRGTVEVASLACPSGEWRTVRDVEIVTGTSERIVALDALRGDVAVPGKAGGATR